MLKSIDPQKIKALALDLDGTLLDSSSQVSKRSFNAIKACKDRGIKIIIATGRSLESGEPLRIKAGATGPAIYCNGASIVDMDGTVVLKNIFLDKKAVDFCIGLSREMGIYYQVYFQGKKDDPRMILMAEQSRPESDFYESHTGIKVKIGNLKEALGNSKFSGCIKSMFLLEPELQPELRSRLEDHFCGSVYIVRTYRTFLEVLNKDATKGIGLAFVMEHLSLSPDEVIAFGDEENDIPMFEVAGFSAAPANAKENVKAKASITIGPNSEDGVAVFLEELFGL